jgi:hypothetical protein
VKGRGRKQLRDIAVVFCAMLFSLNEIASKSTARVDQDGCWRAHLRRLPLSPRAAQIRIGHMILSSQGSRECLVESRTNTC